MARPRQQYCKHGHALADAHTVMTAKGIKRTCRKCRYLRLKKAYNIGDRRAKPDAMRSEPTATVSAIAFKSATDGESAFRVADSASSVSPSHRRAQSFANAQ